MNEALLTVAEVALWLGVHVDTVRRLEQRGELHPYRIGKRLRFSPGDVRAYLDRQRVGVPHTPEKPMNIRQGAAFYARSDELDEARQARRGTSKREALAAASMHFNRSITSSKHLSYGEASWVLDWLRAELEAEGR